MHVESRTLSVKFLKRQLNYKKIMSHQITSPTIPKLTFTRKEAAIALGLSVPTIDRLTQRGLLKATRHTRRPLYALTELNRFAEAPARASKSIAAKQ
jgi:hypothetical protein